MRTNKQLLGFFALLTLSAFAFLAAGCGEKEVPSTPGPTVGAATPTGGTITAQPITGRKPHMAGKPGG